MRIRDCFTTPEKKRAYARRIFDTIASEYDAVSRILSFGRDRKWKRILVGALRTRMGHVTTAVDFACGTGDITLLLSQKFPQGRIVGADMSPPMLAKARHRLTVGNIRFALADMDASPFRTASADIVTGGYALRNAPDLARFLREVHRILRPGGVGAFLDFSRPASPLLHALNYHLLYGWGCFWGLALHRKPRVYGYIAESLEVFPHRKDLERLIRSAGFDSVATRTFFLGTIAIVSFSKPALAQ